MVQQRHRCSILVQPSKEHLLNSNDIAISDKNFFDFDTPNSKRQTMTQQSSRKSSHNNVITYEYHSFLVDIGFYMQLDL